MSSDIQSVEVSFFLHATEDEDRTIQAVRRLFDLDAEPVGENLEGHFGNRIVRIRFHLTGAAAWEAFRRLVSRLGKEGKDELLRDMDSTVDEHSSLFLRLDKQLAVRGSAVLSGSDPIRVKVKPRSYLVKGEPSRFYAELMEKV